MIGFRHFTGFFSIETSALSLSRRYTFTLALFWAGDYGTLLVISWFDYCLSYKVKRLHRIILEDKT